MFSSIRSCAALVLLIAFVFSPGTSASATTFTWNNSGSTWASASNWTPVGPPVSGTSIALFNSGSYAFQPTLSTASGTAGGLWVTGSGALTIGNVSPNVLTLTGTTINGHLSYGIEMDAGAGSVTIAAAMSFTGSETLYNNSVNPLTISGNFVAVSTLTPSGAGTIILTGSDIISTPNTIATARVWSNLTSTGTVSVSGGNFVTEPGTTFTISAGLFTSTGATTGTGGTILGNTAGGTANMVVSGGTFVQAVQGVNVGLFLGQNGPGVLTISNSGLVNVGTAPVYFDFNNGAGKGTLFLNGGALQASGFAVFSAANTGQNVNFNGGVLQLTSSSANLFGSTPTDFAAKVGNGAIIDVNGHSTTISNNLVSSGTGGLTVLSTAGGGILTLTGSAGYAGDTTVLGGTLALNNTALAAPAASLPQNTNLTVSNGGVSLNGSQLNAINNTTGGTVTLNAGGLLSADQTSNNTANLFTLVMNGGTLAATQGPGVNNQHFNINDVVYATGTTPSLISANIGNSGSTTFNIDVAPASQLTISGPISNIGNNAVQKSDSGLLVLTGPNIYAGNTIVNGGTLAVDATGTNIGSLGATAVNVAGGASFLVRGNTSIASGGSLGIAGGGALDLRDGLVNTFTVNGNLSFGTGSQGSSLYLELGTGTADLLNIAGAAALAGTSSVNLSLAPGGNIVPGQYSLIVAGSGLNASNFSVGAKPAGFNAYTLSTPTAGSLVLSITGNAIPATAYWTGAASLALSDSANQWGVGSSISTSNWSTTPNGLTDPKQVPGAVTNVFFTAANATAVSGSLSTTLDGGYSINSLTFAVPAGPISSVTINTNGNVLSSGSGGLTLTSTSNASSTINGGGSLLVSGNQSWANNSNTQGLTIAVPVSAQPGATTLTLNGSGSGGMTLSGIVSDGGGPLTLVFTQAGTTILGSSNANTYSGGTTISSGTVKLAGANALGVGGLTANGGVLDLNGFSYSPGNLSGLAGTIVNNSGAGTVILSVGSSGSAFGGVIADNDGVHTGGSIALQMAGPGQFTLSGANTYSQGTTISGGTLALSGSGALGSGNLAMTGGALDLGGGSASVGAVTVTAANANGNTLQNGSLTGTSYAASNTSGNAIITANLLASGSAGFAKTGNGGQVTLAGSNTYTGGTTVSAGTLNINSNSAVGSGLLTLAGGNLGNTSGGPVVLGNVPQVWNNSFTYNSGNLLDLGTGPVNVASNPFTVTASGGTLQIDGNVTAFSTTSASLLTLATSGAAAIVLTGSDSFTSATGNVFNVNGNVTTTGTISTSGGNLLVQPGATFTVSSGLFAASVSGAGIGSVLGNTNGVAANMVVSGGTFSQSGGGLYLGQHSIGVLTISNTGLVNLQTAPLNFEFNGTGGVGVLNLNGGTLQCTGFSTGSTPAYAGQTVVFNGGLLQLTNNSTNLFGVTPTNFAVNVGDGGVVIDLNSHSTTISNSLATAGLGGLAVYGTGGGTLTLTANNTYAGPTQINGGLVALGGAATLGSGGSLTMSGGQLDLGGSLQTFAAVNITNAAPSGNTIQNGSLNAPSYAASNTSGNAIIAAGLQANGNAGFTMSGVGGRVTLAATNTYTGDTDVTGGTLALDATGGNTGSLGSTNVYVSTGAGFLAKGNTSIGGSLTVNGGASLDLRDAAANTFSINGALALGSGSQGSNLNFELGGGSADLIAATGSAVLAGTSAINLSLIPASSVVFGQYTIIAANSGLSAGNFNIGSTLPGFNIYTLSSTSSSALVLSVTGNPTPTTAYWTGKASAALSDAARQWGIGSAINTSNWSTTPDGLTDALQVPGGITDVYFTAANASGLSGSLTTTLDGPYSIAGLTFAVTSGTITSVAINTAGNLLTIGSDGLALAGASLAGGTISGSGGLLLSGSQRWANNSNSQSLNITAPVSALSGATTLLVSGSGSGGVSLSGLLSDGSGTLSLAFNQAGTTILSGSANTFSGGATIAGGLVKLASTGALSYVNGALTANGGTFDLNGLSPALGALSGAAGTILNNSGSGTATLSIGGGNANGSTFYGTIADNDGVHTGGAVSLQKIGTGNLLLAGSNTYSGGTLLNQGSLGITADSALGAGGVTFTGNSSLQAAANGIALAASRAISIASGTTGTLDTQGYTMTVAGLISGSGALAKAGTGMLILTNSNNYSGGTIVGNNSANTGIVEVTSGGAFGSGLVTIFSNKSDGNYSGLYLTNNVTVPNNFNASGFSSDVAGNGMIRSISGSNALSGIITMTAGGGDTSVQVDAGSSLTLTGTITSNTTARVLDLEGAGSGSVTGMIVNGPGAAHNAVNVNGPGVWNLSGVNSYSATTTVINGALQALDGVGLPSSSNLVFGGSFALNGNGAVLQSSGSFTRGLGTAANKVQWTGDGGFSANGGPLTVSINHNLSDPLVWGSTTNFLGNGNVLTFGSPTANSQVNVTDSIDLSGGTRQIDVAAGTGGDNALLSGNIIDGFGGGALLKTGAGTLILSGSNAYGGTIVDAGSLVVNSVNSLAGGSSLTVGQDASSIFAPAVAGPSIAAAAPAGVNAVPEPGSLMLLIAALCIAAVGSAYRLGTAKSPRGFRQTE